MTQTTAPTTAPEAGDPAPDAHVAQPVRIPHAPGLDGLRGLAVAAVVVFHAGPATWLPGGFLGVSLFFTLSGYLITSLVLAEVRRDRHLALGAFWARRFRRLVPALVATSLAVVVLSWFVDFGGDVRADLIGGLTYSANWVQIVRDQSYAELFLAPSPLIHLWSLAIEEQFYVVLPLVVWVLARRAPWLVRNRLLVGGMAITVLGVVVTRLADDPTMAYYGTLSRAPEIAVGVVLAARTRVTTERAPGWLTGLGVVALAVSVALWRTAAVTDAWIEAGGLAAFAVVSAVLVRVASRPGPIATALSWRPLCWLGLVSYGLYLYHWPVVVLLGWPRVDWDPVPMFAARLAVSLGLAALSYRFLEQPLRRGRPEVPTRTVIVAGLGALAATLLLVLATVPPGDDAARAEPAAAVVDPASLTTEAAPPGEAAPAAPVGPPVVVLLGDSLPAWMLRDGGDALDPDEVAIVDGTIEACDGAEGAPEARSRTGAPVPIPADCTGWSTQYPPLFQAEADRAVLMVGSHTVLDRKIDGEWRNPCEPEAQRWYGDDMRARLEYLAEHSTTPVLVLPAWADRLSGWINPADHLDRMDCIRATMIEAAADTGTATIDFGRYLCPEARDRCRPVRTKDGVHLDPGAAPDAITWVIDSALAAG